MDTTPVTVKFKCSSPSLVHQSPWYAEGEMIGFQYPTKGMLSLITAGTTDECSSSTRKARMLSQWHHCASLVRFLGGLIGTWLFWYVAYFMQFCTMSWFAENVALCGCLAPAQRVTHGTGSKGKLSAVWKHFQQRCFFQSCFYITFFVCCCSNPCDVTCLNQRVGKVNFAVMLSFVAARFQSVWTSVCGRNLRRFGFVSCCCLLW